MTRFSQRERGLRILRAAREVLTTYRLTPTTPGEIVVEGGRQQYVVRFCESWTRPAVCSCPDGARADGEGYCKHVTAVLLSQPALRAQLLEVFL